MPRSSIHSLKIRMTSYPCNKYERTTLSYLPSVNENATLDEIYRPAGVKSDLFLPPVSSSCRILWKDSIKLVGATDLYALNMILLSTESKVSAEKHLF